MTVAKPKNKVRMAPLRKIVIRTDQSEGNSNEEGAFRELIEEVEMRFSTGNVLQGDCCNS